MRNGINTIGANVLRIHMYQLFERWMKKDCFYIALAQGLTMTQAHLPFPLSGHQRRLCDSWQACETVYHAESKDNM